MSDRITLRGMRFEGRHGVSDEERAWPQLIEVDVHLTLDLADAGRTDDLTRTVDYGAVFERCRVIVEERSYRLLEAIAEAVASDVLGSHPVEAVEVRVRKLAVPLDGDLDHAEVAIVRAPVSPTRAAPRASP